MKIKDLHFDIAKKICVENLVKYDYSESACSNCPLWLNNNNHCARDIAWLNTKFGNIEINLKEREK